MAIRDGKKQTLNYTHIATRKKFFVKTHFEAVKQKFLVVKSIIHEWASRHA